MKQLDLFDSFQLIQSDFEDAEKELKKATERYTSAKKLRDDNCPHSQLVRKESYFKGGYHVMASTDYWDECLCCGKGFNFKTQNHSWYE